MIYLNLLTFSISFHSIFLHIGYTEMLGRQKIRIDQRGKQHPDEATIRHLCVMPRNAIGEDAAEASFSIKPGHLLRARRRMVRPLERPMSPDVALKHRRHLANIMQPARHLSQVMRPEAPSEPCCKLANQGQMIGKGFPLLFRERTE